MRRGIFFKYNVLQLSQADSGRRKLLVSTRFMGALSIHMSLWGREHDLEDDELTIAHYKFGMWRRKHWKNTVMIPYTDRVLEMAKELYPRGFA